MRRVRDCMVVGVAGMCIYMLPKGCETIKTSLNYADRIASVESYIGEREFESSRELLQRFKSEGILNPADISELEIKINLAERKAEEEANKAKESELVKPIAEQERIKSGEQTNTEPKEPDNYKNYPENLNFLFGERIDLTGKSLEESLGNIEASFKADCNEAEVYTALERFYDFLKTRDRNDVENANFSGLKSSSKIYITKRRGLHKSSILTQAFGLDAKPVDTPVVIIRKLGAERDGIEKYVWNETPSDIPLYTIGRYVRDSNNQDAYHLIRINDKDYWFDQSEIASIPELTNINLIKDIERGVKDILKYVQSPASKPTMAEREK
ncbi:MAG: hypothetical protein A2904_02510 [Candidatus Staskawiczbacteria bacterium RIFCSPLOWO2_01_FULL_33_9]|uniref:Uncharacterized protein n=1 Tax=Candidatus Staskawiczbacteria bacterium RIFCSPLOWO2_01_FULL_33_9 TaxID=1802211 RepID=A0A1G2I7S4_9BACT|nr:MAG: hypothetical protein A2904_02510 [Candidatus Staskawiczbacteria bacterium RIFCSPLOWO2_01_FULL_33_9]